ncbi:DNA polymerase III subunit alpha [Inconstantimicrobium mannanitabidum]|uniref:DNA-directed DNA polymerase n=1 Tax=Inconstantimicrobium mannanitabidum TaxID=1604901 RepID=A0ACB5RG20_9CLOT|nr:DNA polymerase III subunit alpha [Clostridium sp. TW13]GKX68030.1 DNA-directed DNA polymerase [Clostridium sp. TW13]
MENRDFVHLHLHTGYSLLDGSAKIKNIIQKAKELNMHSIGISDHGVMYGCVELYKAAKDAGIKPILGCEVYVAPKSMKLKNNEDGNGTYHLVLLVKNETGYKNLMNIVSSASIDGFYYKPRVDHEFLKNNCEGLVALSACLGGEVQSLTLNGQIDKAKETALFYKKIFKEDFYLELQYHGMDEERKVNGILIEMAKELDIPLVATNDVHYIEQKDAKAHDILLCIQTGKTVDEEKRMRYPSDQFYLKSKEEMWELFSYVPEALENTVKIAEKCNFDYEFHVSKLPRFPLPEGVTPFGYLAELCFKGMIERYDVFEEVRNIEFNIDNILKVSETSEEAKLYTDRLNYELGVINQMGYVDYFLIVWDFIKFANDNGIPTGPGRGSGAGSIVAYTLGITKIDPIKYGLIFERFLNPERVSMPDIDSDFCYERRQEVIDYVVRRYGSSNVSQIITFGTMAARMCIRDVGRAMNYSYAEVDKVAKMIPSVLGVTIEKALDLNPELKAFYDSDERVKELIDISKSLEGLPRHSSTHAAGVVIASRPLVEYVPLQRNEDNIVTQFDMTTLEELGLLKMDFLGLRTLTVLKDAVDMIKVNKGIDIDLDKIDFNDSTVYKMIGDGETVGVFQLESAGITSFMKELKPDSIEDIIAGISLYRPGPMAEIPRYIQNKNNPDKIEYITPELEPILNVTYGVMVYQEQVMQIVRDLAGYSLGRSDLVRRAMSKKKHSVMEQERKNFVFGIEDENGVVTVPGCIRNGISEEAGNKIFDQMMDFASYAFNKSHAAAYAVVGFQTAYLMRYYPVEYIAAMLNSVMGSSDKVAFYIRFAEKSGIKVLPPDINESYSRFTVDGDTIRFGLAAVKNVGGNVVESIVKSRNEKGKFNDLQDFCYKVDTAVINKRALESLIKVGAFDQFGIFRSKLLAVHEKLLDGVNNQRKKNIEGQISLFGEEMGNVLEQPKLDYPNIKEFNKKNLLAIEKEMTGLYLSGHPLDEYEQSLKEQTSIEIEKILAVESSLNEVEENEFQQLQEMDLDTVRDGERVLIGGIISSVSRKVTRNNDIMAFVSLEDLTGIIEVIVFPKTMHKVSSLINEDELVVIRGRVSIREDEEPKILCEDIMPLEKVDNSKLYLRVENTEIAQKSIPLLKVLLTLYKGETPIYIYAEKEKKTFRMNHDMWVRLDEEVMEMLRGKFGENNVKIVEK